MNDKAKFEPRFKAYALSWAIITFGPLIAYSILTLLAGPLDLLLMKSTDTINSTAKASSLDTCIRFIAEYVFALLGGYAIARQVKSNYFAFAFIVGGFSLIIKSVFHIALTNVVLMDIFRRLYLLISFVLTVGLCYLGIYLGKKKESDIETDEQPSPKSKDEKKLGLLPYVLGFSSFIPGYGVPLGIIAIVWGISKKKQGGNRIVILGICGIVFTIIVFSTMFYIGFVQKGGFFNNAKIQASQMMLNELVKNIEYYKIQNGKYPEKLENLTEGKEERKILYFYDPISSDFGGKKPKTFYYELIDNGRHYYLLSSGLDGMPFTEDDLYPSLSEEEIKRIGYTTKKP